MIFAGVDWAEAHHDVYFQDDQGHRLAGGRLAEGVAGIARFHELAGAHAAMPEEVMIGIATDRGLFVAALVAAGYQVFAVNPMSASRYRDRHGDSGANSDPGDAKGLADLVRTDRHNHRPVAGDSDLAQGIRALARAPGGRPRIARQEKPHRAGRPGPQPDPVPVVRQPGPPGRQGSAHGPRRAGLPLAPVAGLPLAARPAHGRRPTRALAS